MALSAANPGIFFVNSGPMAQYKDVLPYSTYVKWYETVHIPDWMGAKAGAITSAWRYQCLDPDRPDPFLVTYKYLNISDMSAPEFRTVTLNNPLLPEGGPVNKFAHFAAISGPHIETWRSGSTGDGITTVISILRTGLVLIFGDSPRTGHGLGSNRPKQHDNRPIQRVVPHHVHQRADADLGMATDEPLLSRYIARCTGRCPCKTEISRDSRVRGLRLRAERYQDHSIAGKVGADEEHQ
jgi:hypothetical protein